MRYRLFILKKLIFEASLLIIAFILIQFAFFLVFASTYINMSLVVSEVDCQRFISTEWCKKSKHIVLYICKEDVFFWLR